MAKHFFLLSWTINLVIIANGQTPISINLKNPSFEDVPRAGQAPKDWDDVHAYNETPPDTQPYSFGVTKQAKEGQTYLGLVVRDNETTEAVRQRLTTPLLKDVTYKFSFWACRSALYISQSRKTGQNKVNFNTPVLIEIWACNSINDIRKLATTQPITFTEWEKFDLEFTPKNNYNYLIINAYYTTPEKYNGNVLVDNLSAIEPKNKIKTPNVVIKKPGITPPKQTKEPHVLEQPPKSPPPTDSLMSILNIEFDNDSSVLPASAFNDLDKYVQNLKANLSAKALVEGFTNDQINPKEAVPLSLKRAQAICAYWVKKGINSQRLSAKGLGKADFKGVKITIYNSKK